MIGYESLPYLHKNNSYVLKRRMRIHKVHAVRVPNRKLNNTYVHHYYYYYDIACCWICIFMYFDSPFTAHWPITWCSTVTQLMASDVCLCPAKLSIVTDVAPPVVDVHLHNSRGQRTRSSTGAPKLHGSITNTVSRRKCARIWTCWNLTIIRWRWL